MDAKTRRDYEWRLRARLTDLLIGRGYEREIFFLDLFSFLDDYLELSPIEIRTIWESDAESHRQDRSVSLYLHVPFCRCRCEFCRYHQWLYVNDQQLDHYVDSMCREMEFFSKSFKNAEFQSLYVGGGTPNLLSAEHLKKIFQVVHACFRLKREGEKTFECNPFDTTYEKLSVLSESGINCVSFGVQSGNVMMLDAMNRGYQSFSMVREAVSNAKTFQSFQRVNVDLMIGLWHDTVETVFESFCRMADLSADTISVYPLTPQPEYLAAHYQGDQLKFAEELRGKMLKFEEKVVPEAQRRGFVHAPLEAAFHSDSWGFVSKQCYESGWKNVSPYSSSVDEANYLGIGAGAISNIMGEILYKNEGLEQSGREGFYFSRRTRYRGRRRHCEAREKLRFIVQELSRFSEISRRSYKDFFGSDVFEDYQEGFDNILALGGSCVLEITNDTIKLKTRDAREKFIYTLFFLNNQDVGRMSEKHITCYKKNR